MLRRLLCACCLVSALTWAQSYTASVRGSVTDSSHAAVPSAAVVLTETTQNVEYRSTTDSSGRYVMPSVPRGHYTLAVEAAGFKKAVQAPFDLEVQQQATFDFEMEVGQVNTAVEVTGSAPLINTTSATLGQVVDNKFIDTMPLSGRNPLTLARLAPGIVGDTGGVNFSANGTRNSTSDVMLDGSIITGIEQNGGITDVKYVPSVDVVQEFKVQTNYFSAEFGNTGGAVINIVSKSGTNDLHGVGYEFHSDSALNANTWESNRNGGHLPDSHKDIFGYAFGGPVILPKLYNGRNKTFFFTNYEGQRSAGAATSTTSQNTVPTTQQRAGDFSDVRLQNGAPVIIYNPFSTYLNNDDETMRNPFPANRIPASMMDPIAVKLASYYAKPISDGNQYTHVNNWFAQGTNHTASNQLAFKIDENLSDKQRFSARYTVNWDDSQPFNALGNDANGSLPDTSRTQNGVVDYTRTQNPTTVINLRGGVTRAHERHVPAGSFEQTSLGFPSILDFNGVNMFPRITTSGYQSLGVGGYALIWRDEDVYTGSGSVTKILGGHTLKVGAEVRRLHENYYQPNLPQGGFSFNRAQTGQNPLVASSKQGDAFASMLLNWGSAGSYSIDVPAATTSGYFGGYLQDDWRITKKLTLNLGLRYDFDIPRTERFNREDWWDPSAPSPLAGKLSGVPSQFIDLKGAYKFVDGSNRSPFDGDYNNIQPRIGFAFALNNKTAIRGGYGIFYSVNRDVVKGEVGYGWRSGSSVQWSRDSDLTRYATLENPFPNGLTLPAGRDPLMCIGLGCSANVRQSDNPQYQQWNFSVERELPGNSVLEVNYSASKGTHLYNGGGDILGNYNKLDPRYFSLGRDALEAQVDNPFYGLITDPRSILSDPTVPYQVLLRPYPQYADGSIGDYLAPPNNGNSIYHSAQFKFEKRFSHGVSVLAHYTISKLITDSDSNSSDTEWLNSNGYIQNWANLRQERSLGIYDVPQRAVFSFDYQLPIGRNRMFGKSMNRVLDGFIGGWEVSGILTFASGFPIVPGYPDGTLWDSVQRPNLIGNPGMPGSVHDRLNNYFNVNAFADVDPDTYGSAPRTLPNYRAPGIASGDMTLAKSFAIQEHKSLQLRLEGYNITNTPQFSAPNSDFGDPAFGTISGTRSGTNRTLQLAAKFYF
jgi:hypothetical protein